MLVQELLDQCHRLIIMVSQIKLALILNLHLLVILLLNLTRFFQMIVLFSFTWVEFPAFLQLVRKSVDILLNYAIGKHLIARVNLTEQVYDQIVFLVGRDDILVILLQYHFPLDDVLHAGPPVFQVVGRGHLGARIGTKMFMLYLETVHMTVGGLGPLILPFLVEELYLFFDEPHRVLLYFEKCF